MTDAMTPAMVTDDEAKAWAYCEAPDSVDRLLADRERTLALLERWHDGDLVPDDVSALLKEAGRDA